METNTIKNGIGSPRVWLYINKDEMVRDYDEQPISKYLTNFSYTYNEEQDDECKLTFRFINNRTLDLPFFNQDVTFEIDWGYVSTGGLIIKSPRRLIAIRDIDVNYENEGCKVTLMCTDLVSYLKGMKTKVVKNYVKSPGSNANDRFFNDSLTALAMNINERTKGNITATIRKFDEVLRINTTGELKVQPNNNPLINSFNKNNLVDNNFLVRPRINDFVVKGNAQSYDWLSKRYLENIENDFKSQEFGQAPIMDSTDNNLEYKYRDFNKPIFKSFTWAGGNGELLSFTCSTNTRKNKITKAASTNVDPFTKSILHSQVDTIDTAKYKKYSKSDMETIFKKLSTDFKNNYMNNGILTTPVNDKVVIKKYKGKEIKVRGDDSYDENNPAIWGIQGLTHFTMGLITGSDEKFAKVTEKDIYEHTTHNYIDILQHPDWKAFSEQKIKSMKIPVSKDSTISRLASHTIEKINRKFEAEARMIGDPTLIKGKIYQFNNLGKNNTGKWYSVSCKHEISIENGYLCSLGLMRNPKPVGLSAKTVAVNPKFDRVTKVLNMDSTYDENNKFIFEQNEEDERNNLNNIDDNKTDKIYRETSPIDEMINRSEILKSEKDFIDDLDNSDEFTVAKNEFFINNETNNNEN